MEHAIERAIRQAGSRLEDAYGHEQKVREKERYHLVSDLDLEISTLLTRQILAEHPDDGVYSEEESERQSASGDRWIIDPIDGTAYLIFGIPFFSISVARESAGQIVEGHVFNPISDEHFFAQLGSGIATRNGNAIRTSNTDSCDEALVAFGFSVNQDQIARYLDEWRPLVAGMRKGLPQICPALSICNVARGRIDAYIDFGCSFEGQAAASLILRNAGGAMRNYDGDTYSESTKGGVFTNGTLPVGIDEATTCE